ncbi:MAG: ribosome biogenesis protein [Candidatus Micrarchaeota archaeon]|nr:ribosome biogenesis protein [Candidatus Micrarchaeota archaeon]
MKSHIFKCRVCGRYTMQEAHCGAPAASAHPPKYSPQDRYAKYRRLAGRG